MKFSNGELGRVTPCAPSWRTQTLSLADTAQNNQQVPVGRRRRAADYPPCQPFPLCVFATPRLCVKNQLSRQIKASDENIKDNLMAGDVGCFPFVPCVPFRGRSSHELFRQLHHAPPKTRNPRRETRFPSQSSLIKAYPEKWNTLMAAPSQPATRLFRRHWRLGGRCRRCKILALGPRPNILSH